MQADDQFSAIVAALRLQGARLLPSEKWTSLYDVTIKTEEAQIARQVLHEIHIGLAHAREEGESFRAFNKKFKAKFLEKGWAQIFHAINPYGDAEFFYDGMVSPSLEVLFRLDWSMRATLEDWEGHLETKGSRPYWRYTALIDNHTHHMHKVWHGLILPADHPWWRVHYPPNGRNCRCKVMSVSEDDLRHDGWVVSPEPPQDIMTSYLHPITGKELFTPEGIEPGWDCCPGDWSNRLDSPVEISAHHLASCLLSLEKEEDDEDEE